MTPYCKLHKIKIQKYGTRAYHVFIQGEHWGNVCGYEDRAERVWWTATWFARCDMPIPEVDGKMDLRHTRDEAIAEVRINTAHGRVRMGM